MPNRLFQSLSLLFAVGVMAGCGNKGELFLPDEPQLPEQLEATGKLIDDTLRNASEDSGTTKKKTLPIEP